MKMRKIAFLWSLLFIVLTNVCWALNPNTISCDNPNVSVNEDGTSITFYFTLQNRSSAYWNNDLTVRYNLQTSTATRNSDYSLANTYFDITFPASLSSGGSASYTIPITNDSSYEDPESINFHANSYLPGMTTGYDVITPDISVTIIDDDVKYQLWWDRVAAYENGGSSNGVANLIISRNANVGAATVNYSITGTAANGTDFSPTLSGSATIAAGSNYVVIPITITSDTIVEGVETVVATLTSGSYWIGTTNTGTLLIYDDYATVSVTATDSYGAEAGPNNGKFTLTRSGNTNKAITVKYTITGTATSGQDFSMTSTSSVSMAAGVLQQDLVVTVLTNTAAIETAETVVLTLKTDNAYALGASTNAVVTITGEDPNPRDSLPTAERYIRGSGTNLHYYSMVVPLSGLKGTRRPDLGTSTYTNLYHYSGTNSGDQTYSSNRFAFNLPIASFGSSWGTPLYIGESYPLGIYTGDYTLGTNLTNSAVEIHAFWRSNGTFAGSVGIVSPTIAVDTNGWINFTTNGFARGTNGYGLTTVLRDSPTTTWGQSYYGGFTLTHTATAEATNYYYLIKVGGSINAKFTTIASGTNYALEYFYELNFEQRPPWRATFVDQPQFQNQPLPPFLLGKTPEELMQYGAAVNATITNTPTLYTTNDASPELWRHPTLDQFVADMNNDPIALANYVFNEIGLTDAIAYKDDGAVTNESINMGGVNRNALGVFMEGQGSPVEQCALLVYFLRQAGYPAAYVFPPDGGLKMLDRRVSQLLRVRVNQGQDSQGRLYLTNSLISVNYPWVATYINGQWVHLFPWLKDTEVIEGLDLYDYLPDPYKDEQLWVRDYVLNKTNVTAFAKPDDDTAGTVFTRYLKNALNQYAPGISIDDIGMHYVDRRHLYSRWEDFPRPTWVTNVCTPVESLGSTGITNVSPRLAKIFNTVGIELTSLSNPSKTIQTMEMLVSDLQNRKLFVVHTNLTTGDVRTVLSMAAFRPSATNTGSFVSGGTNMLKKQVATLTLDSTDDYLVLRVRHLRQRALSLSVALDPDRGFLDLIGVRAISDERILRKGDLAAICMNLGKVTPKMLQVHASELWAMEQQLNTNSAAAIPIDVYQGTVVYLCGMSYYERCGRFGDLNARLHKVQNSSRYSIGLSKISPRRQTGGVLYTNVDPIWPNVDMFVQDTVLVGNGTVRLDSGWDQAAAVKNYMYLDAADGSSREHEILNTFYGQSRSVSTVKLLQIAQNKVATGGPAVVELNKYNYAAAGTVTYNGKQLKDYDADMWSRITSAFSDSINGDYTVAWVTPGDQTNSVGSYKGMAALILSPLMQASLISNNQNGGYGEQFAYQTFAPANIDENELEVSVDSDTGGPNYELVTDPPTAAAPIPAPEVTATIDVAETVSEFTLSDFFVDPQEQLLANSFGSQMTGAPQDYEDAYAEMYDSGGFASANIVDGNGLYGFVADPVDTLTGEFYINEADVILPGPMPLELRRNYGSHNLNFNELGYGWKLNYMPYLALAQTNALIYAAEPNGSVLAFSLLATNLWAPRPEFNPNLNNYTLNGAGTVGNRLNARIVKSMTNGFTYYYLTNSDGSLRVFQEKSFPLSAGIDRLRPYLTAWYDNRGNSLQFEYGTNNAASDFGEVRRIQSSNGNVLLLSYDNCGRISEVYTLDGRRTRYTYDEHGDLVKVVRPDASEVNYEYKVVTWSPTNGVTNVYSTHLIVREDKPDGRALLNEYDGFRRVTNQWATVGTDLRLVRNATFLYTNNFSWTNLNATLSGVTTVLDFTNNTTVYYYTNGLIRKIVDPLNRAIVQDWYEASETNAPAYPRSLKTIVDKRGTLTAYLYDDRGNVTNVVKQGDITGDGITNQTSVTHSTFNARSLPIEAVDPIGNRMQYVYDTQFPFLLSQVIRYAGATPVTTNLMTYGNATNVYTNGASIFTNIAFGLLQQRVAAFCSPDAVTNLIVYDGRGYPTQMVALSGTTDPNVVQKFVRNNRGEVVEAADAIGRRITFDYDAIGRPTAKEVFEAGANSPSTWSFQYYNQNGEPTWSDGPRFNPEDYTWRDYDGAGRETVQIRWRSQAKSDGTGVEAVPGYDLYATAFKEYDPFGNLTRAVDPAGVSTITSYDAIGQSIRRRVVDSGGVELMTEGFAYEPGGEPSFHTNSLGGVTETQYTSLGKLKLLRTPDGMITSVRYYLDGRLYRLNQENGSYWQLSYDDLNLATTKVFYSAGGLPLATNVVNVDRRGNVIRHVDAAGISVTNSFDGLNRIKWSAGPVVAYGTPPGAPIPPLSQPNVQQAVTNFYDGSGSVQTNVNALGERHIRFVDAVGRRVREELRAADNTLLREISIGFASDGQSVSVTNGSGTGAIVSTTFSDNDGNIVLAIGHPQSNTGQFSRKVYDVVGNLMAIYNCSSSNSSVTTWSSNSCVYDGLHRLRACLDKDNALTTLDYDAGSNLTNRVMPGGLKWQASYDVASRLLSEKNVGTTGITTRQTTYTYYPSNHVSAGRLATRTDSRGVVCTYGYDAWMRLVTNAYTGPLPEQNLTTTFAYDARGQLLQASEAFASPTTGAAVDVYRSYDAYGQLFAEAPYLDGVNFYTAQQSWNAAGRRNGLGFGDFGYGFATRPDGLLSAVTGTIGGANYSYDTAGQLQTRQVGTRTTTTSQRDGVGRPLGVTSSINGTPVLTESLSWTADGLLSAHSLQRPDFIDQRAYQYASLTRRLSEEKLNLNGSTVWTNDFGFDAGQAGGAGVLTSITQPQGNGASWRGGMDSFLRVSDETNNVAVRPAYGNLNGSATLVASVDGRPMPVSILSQTSSNWPFQWRATLELTPGAHQLKVDALHPSGWFATNASVWITNNASDRISTAYDADGNLTNRVWIKASGSVQKNQSLSWDGRGRLFKVSERDSDNSGFDWQAVYDPLGRRLRTYTILVTNGVSLTAQPKFIDQAYDPLREFLELGVYESGAWTWKLYGPDLNGVYGGMNGTGGLEATVTDGEFVSPVISDARGNVQAVADAASGSILWNSPRVTGYGAVPGYRPAALSFGADVVSASVWRGRWSDVTGLTCLGARYYDPITGRFLSPDPMGHASDPSLYSAFNGDPVNYFDADGRLGKQLYLNGSSMSESGSFLYWAASHLATTANGRLSLAASLQVAALYPFLDHYDNISSENEQLSRYSHGFVLDTIGDAELLHQSYDEFTHPDLSSLLGWTTWLVSGAGLVAGSADVTINIATLGGEGLVKAGIKTTAKAATEIGLKDLIRITESTKTAESTRLLDATLDPLPMGQDVLDHVVATDPALQNVRLTVEPTYTPYLGDDVLGRATRYTAIDMENEISSLAFQNRSSLVGTVVHEELHLRIFQGASEGNVRYLNLVNSGADEAYVRAVEARFLRLQNAAGR